MDAIDRAIIGQLVANGRLSNTELSDRVGLTPAPCLRRVRRLERDGVIIGYGARVNPAAVGRGFEVLVNVNLAVKDRDTVLGFENRVAEFEEVLELRRMFGLPDYFLRVAVADLAAYETFLDNKLEAVPGIATIDSHIAIKVIR